MKIIDSDSTGRIVVTWPNGFEKDPDIEVTGITIDCEGAPYMDISVLVQSIGELIIAHGKDIGARPQKVVNAFKSTDRPLYIDQSRVRSYTVERKGEQCGVSNNVRGV